MKDKTRLEYLDAAKGLYQLDYVAFKLIQLEDEFTHKFGLDFQVILARYNTFVDLNNLVFNNKILYVINSVVGATVIILILKNLNVKSRFLRYCGSNSLIIFATHGNLIYLFRKYINTNMHGYISGIGLMILIMLMEVPLIYIIHNYIPWIMGVQKQRK